MNILNFILLVVLFIILLLVFLLTKIKDATLLKILILLVMVIPGFYIDFQGNEILVNFLDLFILVLLLKITCTKSTINLGIVGISFNIFLCALAISIIGSFIRYSFIDISVILKYFRIILIIISYYISIKLMNENILSEIIRFILICGIITGVIGIILFVTQSNYLRPPQTMEIGKIIYFRAGGIFQEPTNFANMMCACVIISMMTLVSKKFNLNKYCIVSLIISLICIVISYSRISFIAISLCTFMIIFSSSVNKRKIFIFIMSLGLVFFVFKDNKFVQEFFYTRIYSVITLSENNINEVSSGRISIWKNNLYKFTSEINILLIGTGYKVSYEKSEVMDMSDNNFISILTQTGIIGFFTFVIMNLSVIVSLIRYKTEIEECEVFRKIIILIFICNVVHMITVDMITFYRNMSLFFMLLGIYKNKYEAYFVEKQNK